MDPKITPLDSDTDAHTHSSGCYRQIYGDEHLPPQLEQFQSILMLLLAMSGAYMYLLPTIIKWQRDRRKKSESRGGGVGWHAEVSA